jgi:hypothetical protein
MPKIWELIGFGKYKESGERDPGFYWVKHEGQWTIAEWHKDGWVFLQHIGFMKDEWFDKIDEQRILPPE